ncbi:outer membrane beta-barrel protein [Flammeovirga sp. SJP92]|uniref:outer membrane beta-barrel protein n=1 Tax=Flammeovirga sp. SJP92 TaxID=1775430 RepID=UPI00155FD74A|nr:outer membrane beta-barrel protein [Flammeovirga sp. SJP92]
MMKKIFFTFICFTYVTFSFAQDLIVTVGNDSISCKIDEIYNDHIYFNLEHKKELKSSLLPLNRVTYYEYGFYNPHTITTSSPTKKPLPKFRFSINGGMSYRLSPVDNSLGPQLKSHFDALKLGYTLGANASFFFNDFFGVGLKYSFAHASHEVQLTGNTSLNDVVKMNYIGPSFMARIASDKNNNAFIFGAGFGYLNYLNRFKLTGYHPVTISGETLGLNLAAGYDFDISDILGVGIQVDLVLGSLTTIQIEENGTIQTIELPEGTSEGLDRVDLTVALIINK